MLDISGGEILLVAGIGMVLIGRKDLPRASFFLGDKVGRVVGFLQGARARGEQYASGASEIKAGLKELRSGLRELDAVKAELAIAATSGLRGFEDANPRMTQTVLSPKSERLVNETKLKAKAHKYDNLTTSPITSNSELAPRKQSVAAVVEDEWAKRGMRFQAKGERVNWGAGSPTGGGSSLLNDIISEGLIHDQYDRVTAEQDDILKSRMRDRRSKVTDPAD